MFKKFLLVFALVFSGSALALAQVDGDLSKEYDEFDGFARVKLRSMAAFAELVNQAVNAWDITLKECESEKIELLAMKARAYHLNDEYFDFEADKIINSVKCK